MADYYLDHGAYPAYAATPTWPVGGTPSAQDGDGKATGIAASATAHLDFTGITASAGHTVVIAGVTLTCVASGATANQFNAGSGATLATNVASAINAATNTVSASASAFTPQLRDFCYGRVNGNKCEIMTRAGSASFNHASNSAMAITTSGMAAPTIVQFVNGTSGAWGYLWNATSSFLPSAKTIGAYGVGMANENTNGRLLAGTAPVAGDIVWMRANNREFNPGAAATVYLYQPLSLVLDASNVKWGDTSGKTFKIRGTGTSSALTMSWRAISAAGDYLAYFASTVYGSLMIYNETTTGSGNAPLTITNGPCTNIAIHFENVEFADLSASSQLYLQNQYQVVNNRSWMFRNCKFRWSRSNAVYGFLTIAGTLAGSISMIWDGCAFVFDALSQVHPGIINAHSISGGVTSFRLMNSVCSSASDVAAFTRYNATTYAVNCIADNLSGFKLSLATQMGLFSMLSTNAYAGAQEGAYVLQQNIGPKKGFRLETPCAILDWIPDANYPGLRSYLPDGTLWSWRTVWSATANHYAGVQGVEIVTLNKQAPASDAVRTVTTELLMDPACLAGSTNKTVEMCVTYTNTSDAQITETTYPTLAMLASATSIASSTAAWTKNGYSGYSAGKLTLTTAQAVKSGTDIAVSIRLRAPSPSGTTSSLFIDPEVDIA